MEYFHAGNPDKNVVPEPIAKLPECHSRESGNPVF
jgi:hypothetical protein